MPRTPQDVEAAIQAVREEDYLRAVTLFHDIYQTEDAPPIQTPRDATGLSYFGLALALVQRKYKPAIDLCKRAIELEFYNGDHYANLTKVYVAAGNRKKALETVEAGLKLLPDHEGLLATRTAIGVRAKPSLPFLDRSHPINVTLGQSRHAKKVASEEKKKR